MTDPAQRTKALRSARLMLTEVRGHLLAGGYNHAVSTLHSMVIPFLAAAAEDEAAATQAALHFSVTIEGLVGSFPLTDWASLDRAEAAIDRGAPLEAIPLLAEVLRLPPARIITALGASEGPKDLLFFWHHRTGVKPGLSPDEVKVLRPRLTGCLLCETPLTDVSVFYPSSTPVHLALLAGLGPQPAPDWTPSLAFGLCTRHVPELMRACDFAELTISEQLKETA